MAKKTVHFERFIGWIDHPHGAQAELQGVRDHYSFGNAVYVRTSSVVGYSVDHGEVVTIETKNTIYKRREPEE